MMKANAKETDRLATRMTGIAAAHTVLGIVMGLQVIAYEAWALITPDAVLKRWVATLAFMAVSMFVWVKTSVKKGNTGYESLLWLLIASDIALASFSVYTQRGMAARAVALYAIPILISALFSRATSLFLTAAVCVVAYVITAVSYFVLNFNEGYKIELYGEVGFYALFFIVFAALIWAVTRPKQW